MNSAPFIIIIRLKLTLDIKLNNKLCTNIAYFAYFRCFGKTAQNVQNKSFSFVHSSM